jgi:hypothetical protein
VLEEKGKEMSEEVGEYMLLHLLTHLSLFSSSTCCSMTKQHPGLTAIPWHVCQAGGRMFVHV